jgi:uracil-DNA glycosylase
VRTISPTDPACQVHALYGSGDQPPDAGRRIMETTIRRDAKGGAHAALHATMSRAGAALVIEFDKGPTSALAQHFASMPSYAPHREFFWYDWGPVFYRGRLNGTARLLGIASDPGPSERIAGRTLVGDAGQRVQGFLAKLGLTRSYVLVNAFAFALFPSRALQAKAILAESEHKRWRNKLYNDVSGPALEAIVAFGVQAAEALRLWWPRPNVRAIVLPHPSSRDATLLVSEWREAVEELRAIITPDDDGDPTVPNYGTRFRESDYARIPPRDLPFGLPAWFGDDSWGRMASPRHNNSVSRPNTDLRHTLVWRAPEGLP